jgi:hypothetical protein
MAIRNSYKTVVRISHGKRKLRGPSCRWEYNIKTKVVPVLLLTEHHAMKAFWGSGGTAPLIL